MAGQTETSTATDTTEPFEHKWETVGWQGLRVSALLLWIGVGSYAWVRSTQVAEYMVSVVGATLGLTLLVTLFRRTDAKISTTPSRRQVWETRVLVGGCLGGIVVGSMGVALSLDQLTVTQPTPSTLAVVGGVLLCGSLLVVASRLSPALGGLAAVAIAVSWASAPDANLVEAAVFGHSGIYGPLTQAAVTWVVLGCLLVGCWRAAGTERQIIALWNAGTDRRHIESSPGPSHGRLRRVAAGIGCMALLIGWQTGAGGSMAVVGLAVVPIGVAGLASLHAATQSTRPTVDRQWDKWAEPAVMVGGPLGVMALLGVGYRLPVGTVLVAGCLCCLGLCFVRPLVSTVDRQSTGYRTGVETILDGSVVGLQLGVQVLVPLMVVGGVVGLMEATRVSTWLVTGVVWFSGGHPVGVILVIGGCCVALGAVLPLLGGYAVGALVGVPLLRLLGSVPELTAHLVVVLGVVVGWLLVAWHAHNTESINSRAET